MLPVGSVLFDYQKKYQFFLIGLSADLSRYMLRRVMLLQQFRCPQMSLSLKLRGFGWMSV